MTRVLWAHGQHLRSSDGPCGVLLEACSKAYKDLVGLESLKMVSTSGCWKPKVYRASTYNWELMFAVSGSLEAPRSPRNVKITSPGLETPKALSNS